MSMSMSMSILEMNMRSDILKGMSEMIGDIVSKAVRHCGSVHNFDAEEMLRKMNVMDLSISMCVEKSKTLKKKENKAKVVKSKLVLPFSGELKEGCCHALRQNHGLYTQCETEVKDERYCNKCGPSPEYGTIEDRLKVGLMEFRDPKGKAPTHFTKVMKKLKISREEVEEEAGKLNIIINDMHFSEEKMDKKEKGRPKKPKRKIELADDSTDLFAVLVAKANEMDSDDEESSSDDKTSIAESIVDSVLDKVSIITENNEKKAEKEAEKLAEKQKKDAEKLAEKALKEAEKLAEKQKKDAEKALKEAEKQALIQKKEAEKALKEAEKLAEKQKKEAEKALKEAEKQKKDAEKLNKAPKSKKETSDSETEKKKSSQAEKKVSKEVEEEEEDVVKRFEFEGVKYLKSKKTGIIYNMDQDVIGKWNEKTNKIDFEEAGSEEEEDEYDA